MKKIIFMGFCLFSLVSSSQSLERSVVAVSGNYYEQPGTGSLSFTLGEIAVATLNSTGNFLTDGGGRLVDVSQITQGFQVFLNVRSLAPGIYFLSILNNTGKRIATRQFVKP
ncbi:MAG: T9SS type A sorting domain-containing protein [Bacteroidetes bacterium]|nr:T9SS type A sorting domain-containing protein [Bacteroidota bacterium]